MPARALVICNDPPYGRERSWNGLRLAGPLARRNGVEVRVFLMGDAVGCTVCGQKVPDGYYHLDRMLEAAARHGAAIGCCGTCLDARGISRRSTGRRRAAIHPRRADRLNTLGRPHPHLLNRLSDLQSGGRHTGGQLTSPVNQIRLSAPLIAVAPPG